MKPIIEFREGENIVIYFESASNINTIEILHEYSDVFNVVYKFSFSLDDSNWSDWVDNIDTFINDIRNLSVYIRVNIKVTQSKDKENMECYSFYGIKYNNTFCPNNCGVERLEDDFVSNENGNLFNVFDSGKKMFHPKNLMTGLNSIRTGLARVVTEIADLSCRYYKTDADTETMDISLRIFEKHNTTDLQDILITFSGGRIPSSRPVYSEYDSGYELGFEIEITRYEFEKAFGKDTTPSPLDYLLLDFDGRTYEVNTVYEDRDIYNESIMWKAYLVKYEDRASVSDGDIDDKVIDYTKYVEGYGIQKQIDEIKDATGKFDTAEDFMNVDDEFFKFDSDYMLLDLNPISNIGANVFGIGVDFPTGDYMYQSASDNIITYDISRLKPNYNIMFWFEYAATSIDDEIKIASFGNYTLYLKTSGVLRLHMTKDGFEQNLITRVYGGVITSGVYAISINHITNTMQDFVTVSVFDTGGVKMQENMTPEKYKYDTPVNLVLHGNTNATNLFGDIRVKLNYVSKDENKDYVFYTALKSEDYIIKDNVKVGTSGDHVRKDV